MAFVNLPPNFQDIFSAITDRIAKLETGPNQAMYWAQSAQATADSAQGNALAAQTAAAAANAQAIIAQSQAVTAQATANTAYLAANVASAQAITAQNTANAAASQATIAQSQATIASTQATTAQTTADGKNKVYYSTSTPGTTANNVGDIWYQYGTSGTYLNKVIAQWSGAGGTSWTSVTVSGLVIANIDAGTITTGVLNAIEINAGSGSTAFHVSPSGVLAAQGAYIKGNITADSGTFNGQVNATSGYFGSSTNGWAIQSTGITGLGTGYISGGTIQGANFNNGNGTFYVNSSGNLVAQSVYIKGAVLGTSGYFGNASNGWNIDTNGITGIGSGYIAGGAIQGTTVTGGTVQTSTGTTAVKMVGASNSIDFINGGTTVGKIYPWSSNGIYMSYASGTYPAAYIGATTATLAGSSTVDISSGSTSNSINGSTYCYGNFYLPNHPTSAAAANGWINATTGLVGRSTASSQRYKTDIVNLLDVPELDPKALYSIPVRAFRFKDDYLPETDDRYEALIPGFIAEEVDAVYPVAADYIDGNVEMWHDKIIIPALLALVQEQNERIKILEGK